MDNNEPNIILNAEREVFWTKQAETQLQVMEQAHPLIAARCARFVKDVLPTQTRDNAEKKGKTPGGRLWEFSAVKGVKILVEHGEFSRDWTVMGFGITPAAPGQ